MKELENQVMESRIRINKTISEIAKKAILDSDTYLEAVKKLKSFSWNICDRSGSFIIEEAIKLVEKEAFSNEIQSN